MTVSRCYIGLGSNLGNRVGNLRSAIEKIDGVKETRLVRHSRFYHSPPWGRTDQPDFVNAVAAFDTGLEVHELLRQLLAIETSMGRRRGQDIWGPRIIDLDILLFGDEIHSADELTVPHPLIQERAFVLAPLMEIAPDLKHPLLNQTMTELAANIAAVTELVPLRTSW